MKVENGTANKPSIQIMDKTSKQLGVLIEKLIKSDIAKSVETTIIGKVVNFNKS